MTTGYSIWQTGNINELNLVVSIPEKTRTRQASADHSPYKRSVIYEAVNIRLAGKSVATTSDEISDDSSPNVRPDGGHGGARGRNIIEIDKKPSPGDHPFRPHSSRLRSCRPRSRRPRSFRPRFLFLEAPKMSVPSEP